jgi:hypothetical protein
LQTLEDKFSEWYSIAVPNFTPQQAAARLQAVAVLKQGLKSNNVRSLVRLFYGMPVGDTYLQSFRKVLKDKDGTYVSNDMAELSIVAGGVIYSAVAEPDSIADAASLAVSCMEAAGLREKRRLDDVVNRCKAYLVEESVRVRDSENQISEFPYKSFAVAIAKFKSSYTDPEAFGAAVDDHLLKLNAALKEYTKAVDETISRMERRRREESNILYWLFGQTTTTDRIPYSGLDKKVACLAAAVDLAKLTEDLPGPIGARSFIQRLIESASGKAPASTSISDCVTATDEGRRSTLLEGYDSQEDSLFAPISFALAKANESGGDTSWQSAFKNRTELDPTKKMRPADLSELFYSEILLRRALG